LRKDFLNWQRDFYKNAVNEAAADPVKAYVFGGDDTPEQTNIFFKMLLQHQIQVYALAKDLSIEGYKYIKDGNFIVPLQQPQYKLIKTIFEKTSVYKDSLFYDITSWTMPLASGIPYAALGAKDFNKDLLGGKRGGIHGGGMYGHKSHYGYLMDWKDFYAPAALYELQSAGLMVKVASQPFRTPKDIPADSAGRLFSRGSIFIPVQQQRIHEDSIYQVVKNVADKYKVYMYSVGSGGVEEGSELGSSRYQQVVKPAIAMITGPGVNATDAGEVWFLLDQRMNIPAVHLEPVVFNRIDLGKYNTLIMVGGNYNELNKEKLKTWVQAGGVLILTEEAVSWAAQNGISDVKFKKIKSPVEIDGAQQMQGAIFGADVDLTHPLAFGYQYTTLSLFKGNKVFMEKSKNPYATPFYYGNKPLQSGWVSKENGEAIKNSAAVLVNTVGNGRVINIADNPNFRAFWLGGSKLFMNAIFFGRLIDAASARTEE